MTTPAEVGPGYRVAGRYRLDSRIAGGGMGAVWLATDERLGRQVAVKQVVLPVGVSPEAAAEQRARTMREGRIAARITHPHAISVYDVVDDGGSPWLVMEHLPSRSLAAVLSADGVLPVQQVAQIGAQLADALVATHAAGIVHRDVKPGNVLVGEGDRLEGLVKITDFGISHATGDVRLTQTGMVTGTPAFLSPEVARGEEPGAAGDVWSLGATLFTALEGDPPFGSSGNSLEQLYRVAAGQFDPPVRSGALTPVLEWMLTPDPAGRPSMTEVRDALAAIAAGSDGDVTAVLTARTPLKPVPPPPRDPTRTDLPAAAPTAPRSAPLPPRTPPRTSVSATPARRRSRTPLVLAALVAVLVLAGGGTWLALRDTGSGTAAAPTTTTATTTTDAPPPAVAPPTTAEQTTSAPPTTTEAPTTEPDVVTAAEVSQFVTDYYALLPDDPDSAYGLTGPTLQGVSSRGNYKSFWKRFDEVVLGPVSATDGSLVATAQVTFVEDDEEQVEQHQFTLVEGPDGTLLMDRDIPL
ncbi:serine/threonine-protein kinase [Klenkia terrae]|uniref:non-specific serine/threonine protein kinase n=1 Tax=Klenkia terrae TaxID=1052259 RepID=A0ABU8EBR9_9ACTN